MTNETTCLVCGSADVPVFFELRDVPVHVGIQWATREEALGCPRGDIELNFCRRCGFIYNQAFDPGRLAYSQAYENPLYFSAYFRAYAESVARRLIERYDLRNKTIIEIGCGKGDFLSLLCELGDNRGVGFDPSYEGERSDSGESGKFTVLSEFYSERHRDCSGDCIVWRYVYEHIPDPTGFLTMVRRTIGDRTGTMVYVEVPDTLFILRDLSVWDIIYEHCAYFTAPSLRYVFARCGFEVRDIVSQYEGQYLGLEAAAGNGRAAAEPPAEGGEVAPYVEVFSDNFARRRKAWQGQRELLERKRSVLWGAGAKGVGFLNLLGIRDGVEYVVDINPHKHGTYIAGTAQRIVPPEFLREYRPELVLVTNPVYKDEIERMIKSLGVRTELVDV